jgi:acetylornithine deacetylase
MARLVGPVSEVQRIIENWLDGRAEVETGVFVPPVRLATLPGFPTSVVSFATDIPALTNWGVPFLYGPGSIHSAHSDAEFIAVDELQAATGAYERLARESLAALKTPGTNPR